MEIARYDILLVDLNRNNPPGGAEMIKVRPCVVISPDEMNRYLRTLVVVPVTSAPRSYPTRIRIRVQKKSAWMVVDQVRTIDRKRVIRKLGRISQEEARMLSEVLRETYVE
jgi:mRNA interferase MazF